MLPESAEHHKSCPTKYILQILKSKAEEYLPVPLESEAPALVRAQTATQTTLSYQVEQSLQNPIPPKAEAVPPLVQEKVVQPQTSSFAVGM